MNTIEPVHSTPVLLTIAALAVVLLLVLIMRFRLHAFVSLVLVSLVTALAAGIPFAKVVPTLLEGFGGTLASVALLVGFGAMIGRLLEVTGGAQVLADRLALSLINRRQLGPADFETRDGGAVFLTDEARKRVLTAWQERKKQERLHPFLQEKAPFGLVSYLQAQMLARHLRGDLDAYPPWFWS